MDSYSRNSRKPLRLALAGAAQAAVLLIGSVVHAAEPPTKFVMTAFTESMGGKSLANGDFPAAVSQLKPGPRAADPAVDTNKCVAYTMTGQFESAQSLCNTAVTSARRDLATLSPTMLWERDRMSEYLAVAYSNRAVLHWLSKDAVAAARDLADAVALSPQADFVARNISALHSPHEHMPHDDAVAQATATPKS